MNSFPLISCLCVTRSKKNLLERAIRCFKSQTYINKELIVVYETGDFAAKTIKNITNDKDIFFIEIKSSPKLTLGELRNISIQQCNGYYFCQWDSDDWYHPKRLEIQLNALLSANKKVCLLSRWILFDYVTNNAYLSCERNWEGSILCDKSLINNFQYPNCIKGEDTPFIDNLLKYNYVTLINEPWLYIYTYNTFNTWNREHFEEIFTASKLLPEDICNIVKNTIYKETNTVSLQDIEEIKERLNEIEDVTGVVVSYNSLDLLKTSFESVRLFHPDMKIIIIDGSAKTNPCYNYVKTLENKNTKIIRCGYNIGHGRGMCIGIYYSTTPYILLFDSDIKMLKSPLKEMKDMIEEDTFGVGYIEKIGFDGYEYGFNSHHKNEKPIPYLHPYFQLIQKKIYKKFYPYVHHGAPCYLTMIDIYNRGLSNKILKGFPGLGHSSGKGTNWVGSPKEYIQHNVAGTRKINKINGQQEIEGTWEYDKI